MAAIWLHDAQVQNQVSHSSYSVITHRVIIRAAVSFHSVLFSEAKACLNNKRIAFIGDSRIRQLFYSFIQIVNPETREEGNKVSLCPPCLLK